MILVRSCNVRQFGKVHRIPVVFSCTALRSSAFALRADVSQGPKGVGVREKSSYIPYSHDQQPGGTHIVATQGPFELGLRIVPGF